MSRSHRCFLKNLAAALGLALASLAPALAQTPGGAGTLPGIGGEMGADFVAAAQHWVDDAVAQGRGAAGTDMAPLRMEVSVGTLDSRLRLAPCASVEPYLPPGQRLWGRSRLGLRCVDGAVRWNVFLPVTVKAIGPAWVLRDGVAPGAVLQAGDAVQAEADWAADASPVVADPAQWVGRVATRALAAGQPIRQAMVRTQQVLQAGASVRILAGGRGFEVSTEGQALSAGGVGEAVRVRMPNGRIATGQVVDAGTVRMAL